MAKLTSARYVNYNLAADESSAWWFFIFLKLRKEPINRYFEIIKFLQFSKFSNYVKNGRNLSYRKVVRYEIEMGKKRFPTCNYKHLFLAASFMTAQPSPSFLYASRYRLSIQLRLYLAVELHPTLLTTIILATKNILHENITNKTR